MSLTDILIFAGLILVLVVLLRSSDLLRKNPYQQLKSHEDLSGKFPQKMSAAEKIQLINLFGLSPTGPYRPWLLLAAVIVFFVLVLSLS